MAWFLDRRRRLGCMLAACVSGDNFLRHRRLSMYAGLFAKRRRDLLGVGLVSNCVRRDEADPKLVDRNRAVFAKDLLHRALYGSGELI